MPTSTFLINLHHAYGILGNRNSKLPLFLAKKLKISIAGNPDFFHERFETLTIDDSRRIKEFAVSRKFAADSPRIFLLEFFNATREAENALLKLLEEPEPGNHFFLVIPSVDVLLPTLRSRLLLLDIKDILSDGGDESIKNNKDIEDFLNGSLKEKIAFVDALSSDISDGKKAKHDGFDFLNNLESFLHEKNPEKSLVENNKTFNAIALARTYMNDRSSSLKMLLEYVALNA